MQKSGLQKDGKPVNSTPVQPHPLAPSTGAGLMLPDDSFTGVEISEEQLAQIGSIPAIAEQVSKINESVLALQNVQQVFVARFDLTGLEDATKVKFQALLAGLAELQTKLSIDKVKANIDIAELAQKSKEAEAAYLTLKDDLLKRVAALEALKAVSQNAGNNVNSGVSEAVLLEQLDAVKNELEAKINEQKERINRRVSHQELNVDGITETASLKDMLDNISALQKALKEFQTVNGDLEALVRQNTDDIKALDVKKADREKVAKALEGLKGLIVDLEAKVEPVAANTQVIAELRQRVNGLDQVFANKDKVSAALEGLKGLIVTLETQVKGLNAPAASAAADTKGLDDLAAKVTELEKTLNSTDSSAALEALNKDIAALKNAPVQDIAAAIDPKLVALESKLQAEIKALADKVAALDASSPKLKSGVESNELDQIYARLNEISGIIWDNSKGLISHIKSHYERLNDLDLRSNSGISTHTRGQYDNALQAQVLAHLKLDIDAAKKKDAKFNEVNHYTNLLKELLGLVVNEKAKAKSLVAHLFDSNVINGSAHEELHYMLYKSLQNLDPNLFGFAASDLSKSDGKSLDELDITAEKNGLWKDANVSNTFYRTHRVETKAEKGKESKTIMKSGVDSPFNVNRHTDATRFAIVREVLKLVLTTSDVVQHSEIAILNRPENTLGLNAAHIFALVGNIDALKSVIEANEDLLNSEDKFGNTVLHYAAANFNGTNLDGEAYTNFAKFTAFEYLVNKGADQSQKNSKGLLPIEVALSSGNTAYIKCFMMKNKAATVNGHEKAQNADDKYLLERAVELGNVAAVSTIRKALPSGATNLRNAAGSTAMHIAAQKGDVKVLEALTVGSNNKVSLQSRDIAGNRPVDLAVTSNNTDAIRWFATHGQYPKEDTKNQVANVILSTVRVAQQKDFGGDVKRMAQDEEWLKNSYKIIKDNEKDPVSISAKTMRDRIELAFRFYIKSGLTPSALFNLTYDSRIQFNSRPHHLDIYNHLVSNMKSLAAKLKDRGNAKLAKKRENPDVYYAFVPDNYEALEVAERNEARDAAMIPANLLYLRELMIAYHLYARKIEAKIGESKTHSEGVFAHILGDLIVALHNQIQDAKHEPRLDAVKLLLTCQNSSIAELQAHTLFAGLPARAELIDNIKAEQGLVDKQFGWMLDPNTKVEAEVKKSRRDLKKEKDGAKDEKDAKSDESKKDKKDAKDPKKKDSAKDEKDDKKKHAAKKDDKKKGLKSGKAETDTDASEKKDAVLESEEALKSPKKKTELKSEEAKDEADKAKAAEEAKAKAKTKTELKDDEVDKSVSAEVDNSVASKKATPRVEEEDAANKSAANFKIEL